MKLFYDLHIHTALSPCGDNDNTPNNIINMSLIKELDVIAICDHNTCANCYACMQVAEGTGLIVIPGMELTSAEDIHLLCLFEKLTDAIAFEQVVKERMTKVKNSVTSFGNQYIMDSSDEVVGECENLLILSSNIDIYEAFNLVASFNGIVVPAHINKASNSLISTLGVVPNDIPFTTVEIHKNIADNFFENVDYDEKYNIIIDSDAHYLGDISEREHFMEVEEKSINAVFSWLRNNRNLHKKY